MVGAMPFPLDEEYKKKTGIIPEDIMKLRRWLETQPHLPRDHITDMDLILAYHCSNRSAEVSKQLVDLHYTLKTLFTNFFKDRYVDAKILKTLKFYSLSVLEGRAHNDSAMVFARLLDYDAKNFIFADVIRAVLMIAELSQYEQGTWPGLVIIIDLDRLTMGHILRLDVQSVQQFLYFLQCQHTCCSVLSSVACSSAQQHHYAAVLMNKPPNSSTEAMLLKVTGVHFLNAPSFMDKLMMVIRPFLNKELMDVLVIHQKGSKTIEKYVPRERLPKELGGNFLSLVDARDYWIEKLRNSDEFFIKDNKKRVNESLRPGKPKTISDIFGSVEGSFKKLEID